MNRMPTHVPSDTQLRMLVLAAMEQLGGATNMQLIAFMAQEELMNYFDLQQMLAKLLEGGFLHRTPLVGDVLYRLTPQGEDAVRLFEDKVPASLIARIREAAPRYAADFRAQREITARVAHEDGQEYHAVLAVNEYNRPIFSVDISLPTATMSKAFCDAWPQRAQEIYEWVMKRLAGGDEA